MKEEGIRKPKKQKTFAKVPLEGNHPKIDYVEYKALAKLPNIAWQTPLFVCF